MQQNYTFAKCIENLRFSNFPLYPEAEPSGNSLIKDLEPDELREVILELCKLTPKNKQFLQLYLQSSDSADIGSIINEAKKKIHGHFYGRSKFPKVDLSNARK